jgi:hypothetical protein
MNAVGRAALVVLLCTKSLAWAEEKKADEPKPPTFVFALKGFVGVTLFAQDGVTRPSEGQLAMWGAPQATGAGTIGGKQPQQDKLIFNGDVRQSRLNFSLAGPQLFGASTPRGVLEVDFFGGVGNGNFGNVSLSPRIRLAYAELDWKGGENRLVFGQNHDLSLPFTSYSLSHLGQPLSFVSGLFGWRRPGVFGYHTVAGDRKSDFLEVAWEVGAPHWAEAGTIGAANAGAAAAPAAGGDRFGFNAGEASGLPAVQARVMYGEGTKYLVYATGHASRVDRSGVDNLGRAGSELDVAGLQLGAKAIFGALTLQSQAFTGKNLATTAASFLQFQPNAIGDMHEYGAYLQAGFNFTPEFSLWGMLGTDKMNPREALRANVASGGTYGIYQNVVSQGFFQYRVDRFAVSLEFTHFYTKTFGSTRALDANVSVNQPSFNAVYFL